MFAEIRSFFPSDSACRTALRELDLRHSALSEEAANLAGRIFRQYRKEGGPRQRFCRTSLLPHMLPPRLTRWQRTTEVTCASIFHKSEFFHPSSR